MNGQEVQQVGHVESQNAHKSNESTFFRSKLARDLSPRRLCEPFELDAKLRTELPALFKLGGSLEALRPQKAGKECDDRKGASKPRLLQQLEGFLEDKLRTAEAMAAQMGAMQDGWAAQTLRLDAYRQTFEAFVNSFSTYKGLLLKVKKEYDKVLEDSLHVSYEHSTMKGELARAEERHNVAVRNAQTEAAASAANLKQRLTERIAETERRGADAQAKAHELELEAVAAREQAIAHDKVTQQLIVEHKELKRTLLDQSSWAGKIRSV